MVFGDYELIHTKRVNRERTGSDPLSNRKFRAAGGYVSLYTALSLGLISQKLSGVPLCSLIPSKDILSRAGFRNYLGTPGKYIILPALIGYYIGIDTAGDLNEYSNLGTNKWIYKPQITDYKLELYYS